MKQEHTREDELGIQIIGLHGRIEYLKRENKKLIEEFLTDLDEYFKYLPVVFEPLRNIKNKWEKRLKQ